MWTNSGNTMKGIITKFDNSKTGTSDYGDWRLAILTIDGKNYSSFEDLDCGYGDEVDFDPVEKDGKMNIVKGTLKVLEKGKDPAPKQTDTNVRDHRYDKDPVGLAVEVFNGMMSKLVEVKQPVIEANVIMVSAIDLVKQAQEAFK